MVQTAAYGYSLEGSYSLRSAFNLKDGLMSRYLSPQGDTVEGNVACNGTLLYYICHILFYSISFLQILPDLGRLFHFFFTYAFFLQQKNAFVLRPGWLQLILLLFWAASISRHVTSSPAVVTTWSGTFTVENDQNYDDGNYHDNTTRNSNNYWKTGWRRGRFSLISIWVRQKEGEDKL